MSDLIVSEAHNTTCGGCGQPATLSVRVFAGQMLGHGGTAETCDGHLLHVVKGMLAYLDAQAKDRT